MPCNSDYLEPNERERELQRTARLLCYVDRNIGRELDPAAVTASRSTYCTADFVPTLCERIRGMTNQEKDAILYNGRDANARDLADWWDTHQEADRQRLAREQEKERLAEASRQHAADKSVLRSMMERQNDWCGQGGAFGYLGDGDWAFTSVGIQFSADEFNALFRLAGVEPRRIQPRGSCAGCAHSIDGRERGYKAPCIDCARPIMSNFTPKP